MAEFVDVSGTINGQRFDFQCPHCTTQISWSAEQIMAAKDPSTADYCTKCGGAFRAWKPGLGPAAGSRGPGAAAQAVPSSGVIAAHPGGAATAVVVSRYKDAYLVGRAVDGIGDIVKGIGLIGGAILILIALLAATKGGAGLLIGLMIVAFAAYVAGLAYVVGIVISAQGQILKATLDTAVNSSPFLNNAERARAMSIAT